MTLSAAHFKFHRTAAPGDPSGAEMRLLAATAIAASESHFPFFLQKSAQFVSNRGSKRVGERVRQSRVRFKARLVRAGGQHPWPQDAVLETLPGAIQVLFDYLWLFDSDVQFATFPIVATVRHMRAGNVMLAQPVIAGSGRTSDHKHLRAPLNGVPACHFRCTNIVEVMTPIFSREAWIAVFKELLFRLPERVLKITVAGIDLAWCPLLRHSFPHKNACAVLGNSTIVHDDRRSIERSGSVLRSKYLHCRLGTVLGAVVSSSVVRSA